jgi:hypothetical protein
MSHRSYAYVPRGIRDRSRVVTWLWRRSTPTGPLTLDRAYWLARWLP